MKTSGLKIWTTNWMCRRCGANYEGDIVVCAANGKGKETFPNGDVYEGDFVNGDQNGTCVRSSFFRLLAIFPLIQ